MNKILDAHALMIFLEKEQNFEIIQNELSLAAEGKNELWMTVINWGEVYYIVGREYGLRQAEQMAQLITTFPINVIPADITLTQKAAHIKAEHKMSYADCFAAALTKEHKGTLLTGDPEFKTVEHQIKIQWL